MTAIAIQAPFPTIPDIDGQPLEDGYIWIGVANLAPITNPITVYWDAALTLPAAQPVRTLGGYPMNSGTPGRLYAATDYSILVQNKTGSTVYSSADNNGPLFGGTISSVDVTFLQAGTGAVERTAQSKMRDVVSVFDFMSAAQIADVQAGTALLDVTSAIQTALNSIGTITAPTFDTITPKGAEIYFPPGVYLTTSTLQVPSNIRMLGTGWGTQFKFNPTAPNSDFVQRKNTNMGGSALNRSNFAMRFEDFIVYTTTTGATVLGRDGSTINVVNTNTRHAFSLTDCMNVTFKNVAVYGFWYGTAFNLQLGALFAYYNYIIGCYTRDCRLSVQTTSASHITDSYFGHSVVFPPPSIQASVQYMVNFDGFRGCAMHGGSIEGSCSVALIKNNGAGHAVTGVYMEAFGVTPLMMDCTSLVNDTGSILMGGNSYGFTPEISLNANITRTGGFNTTLGHALNFGDCDEMEVEHVATRQSPSFRWGLPGAGHFPAGGTLTESTDGFIGNSSMSLARGAGTGATVNQMSYNFKIRSSELVLANIWITAIVKPEGGEDNFDIYSFDATNGNVTFKRYISFTNGWQLWVGYLRRVNNDTITFYARQNVGSIDPARIVKVSALRVYTNGFLPIPSAYKFQEFRTAAPAAGTWVQGDIVWNSQPAAGGTPGWMCATGGTPGTWKAMANLAP